MSIFIPKEQYSIICIKCLTAISVTSIVVASQWLLIVKIAITSTDAMRMRLECRERFPPPPISKETAS